jgi:hypothetical protein
VLSLRLWYIKFCYLNYTMIASTEFDKGAGKPRLRSSLVFPQAGLGGGGGGNDCDDDDDATSISDQGPTVVNLAFSY